MVGRKTNIKKYILLVQTKNALIAQIVYTTKDIQCDLSNERKNSTRTRANNNQLINGLIKITKSVITYRTQSKFRCIVFRPLRI